MNHKISTLGLLFFTTMACLGQTAIAQETHNANSAALIEQLDSNDLDIQEHATESLMLNTQLTDDLLAAALRESKGQKHDRLVNIAMHHFYRRLSEIHLLTISEKTKATGSIGIATPATSLVRADQYENLENPGWLITERRAGFPGFVHLKSGDIITGMENQPFSDDLDQGHFIDKILRYRLNDTMTLNVLRRNKHIVIKLKMGSRERLLFVAEKVAETGDQNQKMFEPWRKHLHKLLGQKTP